MGETFAVECDEIIPNNLSTYTARICPVGIEPVCDCEVGISCTGYLYFANLDQHRTRLVLFSSHLDSENAVDHDHNSSRVVLLCSRRKEPIQGPN